LNAQDDIPAGSTSGQEHGEVSVPPGHSVETTVQVPGDLPEAGSQKGRNSPSGPLRVERKRRPRSPEAYVLLLDLLGLDLHQPVALALEVLDFKFEIVEVDLRERNQ